MPPIEPKILKSLQKEPYYIRNICLLAHVDHGKGTDRLIASNLIISNKIAGSIRYLDSREDEITRGITMKSSAISLYAKIIGKNETNSEYLINLIDSPGHVDFNFEISAASRLCDGALIIIDVIEGCCSQTISMLHHAWIEKLKPILIFNKVDRFILELHLSPEEAYIHLLQLLDQVNNIMNSFFTEEKLRNLEKNELLEKQETNVINNTHSLSYETISELYFSPEKGNVIISSALDGWGFRINQFAEIYENKLGIKQSILNKTLWGPFYLDPKTKHILQPKDLKGRNIKPMFVKLILENIWAIYDSIILNRDQNKIEKIIKNLELKIPRREILSKDPKCLLTSIFSQWLSLSTSVILCIIEQIPSPKKSQEQRLPYILASSPNYDSVPSYIYNSIIECSTSNLSPVIGYISKLVPIDIKEYPENQKTNIESENEIQKIQFKIPEMSFLSYQTDNMKSSYVSMNNELRFFKKTLKHAENNCFIGFARLYSGVITVGQELYIFKPKYDPKTPEKNMSKIVVSSLYLFMGKELIPIEKVYAGNIFGIGGLEKSILKSGTISSLTVSYNLSSIINNTPIVRVAIEPKSPSDMEKLIEGLELLDQADPCVQIQHEDSGEHVILAAGELHLEKCLKDLCEKFAKINIHVSRPSVPFRETIVRLKGKTYYILQLFINILIDSATFKENGILKGIVEISVPLANIKIKLRVYPLPQNITEYIYSFSKIIKNVYMYSKINNTIVTDSSITDFNELKLENFKKQLFEKFCSVKETDIDWTKIYEKIVAFGPNKTGPNILADNTGTMKKLFHNNININKNITNIDSNFHSLSFNEIEKHINTGFQLSVLHGPLAEEPIHGISIFIESIELNNINYDNSKIGQITSHLISSFKDGIKQGFLDWSPRLMLSMYTCYIQAPSDVLGKIHAIISKRKGRIISEELKGILYSVKALLPVIESFGFSEDIRKKTSGAANPQLVFSGFEILNQDPFWISTTKELEDDGSIENKENVSRKYINDIRKRKGLFIDEKIVSRAEKQRTLKR
ncbi:GTPase RIA1 [Pneumocystis jirovecii RU7]|uniref:Ribosome assembly protein 1 n=1 Tax=Pneumocystis jirovecii (strain RU7) TaxID=1408657 RepID=A0A0W4ZIK0_PNEJ7|nr:GTPase RIA1 [Pneumocystis jirovecii RU7]KTW28205.1 hypothetical protein T551_02624 [Pneumocystis jirovecii RU7]